MPLAVAAAMPRQRGSESRRKRTGSAPSPVAKAVNRATQKTCDVLINRWSGGSGRDDWIRTSDPLTPSQVRYQAAPHPDAVIVQSVGDRGARGGSSEVARGIRRIAASIAAKHHSAEQQPCARGQDMGALKNSPAASAGTPPSHPQKWRMRRRSSAAGGDPIAASAAALDAQQAAAVGRMCDSKPTMTWARNPTRPNTP